MDTSLILGTPATASSRRPGRCRLSDLPDCGCCRAPARVGVVEGGDTARAARACPTGRPGLLSAPAPCFPGPWRPPAGDSNTSVPEPAQQVRVRPALADGAVERAGERVGRGRGGGVRGRAVERRPFPVPTSSTTSHAAQRSAARGRASGAAQPVRAGSPASASAVHEAQPVVVPVRAQRARLREVRSRRRRRRRPSPAARGGSARRCSRGSPSRRGSASFCAVVVAVLEVPLPGRRSPCGRSRAAASERANDQSNDAFTATHGAVCSSDAASATPKPRTSRARSGAARAA